MMPFTYVVSLIAGRHLPGLAGLDIGHEVRRIAADVPPTIHLAQDIFPATEGWNAHSIVSVPIDDPQAQWAAIHACRTVDTDPPTVGLDHRLVESRTEATALQQARTIWPLTAGWYGHGVVQCQWPPLDPATDANLLLTDYLRLPPPGG